MSKAATKDSLLPPRWLLALMALAALIWLLFALKEIVSMLVLGYALAYAVNPMLNYLQRRGLSRTAGFFVICATFLLAIILLFYTAVPTVVREFDKLVDNFPQYVERASEKGAPLFERAKRYLPADMQEGSLVDYARELLSHVNTDTIRGVLAGIGGALLRGYSITLTILNFLLLPFIVFYLAVDLPRFHAWVLSLFPVRQRRQVVQIASEIHSHVSAFVRGQLTVGSILFLFYCIGLGIIGVELWFLLAVISGFGAIIPYMGFLVGIVLSSIMALATFGDLAHLIQVIIVFLVVQFLEGTFITPKIVGDKVGLSPLVVILAVVAGGQLFGLLGVFLAVPGAAVARVLLRHAHAWLVAHAQ